MADNLLDLSTLGLTKRKEAVDLSTLGLTKRSLAENIPDVEIIGGDQLSFQAPPKPEPMTFDFDKAVQPFESTRNENDTSLKDDISRSVYPIVRPFLAQGYTAASALNRGLATFSTHLDIIGDWINEKTGGVLTKGGLFEEAAKVYEANADYWKKRADQIGVNFIDELVGEAIGGAAPGITEFIMNVPYATVLGAAKAGKEGRSELAGALVEGAKRGVLGAMFHAMSPLNQYLRAPGMGSVFALQAAGEGGDVKEVTKAFLTGGLFSLGSPGGKMGLNEVRANLKRELVRVEAEKPRIEPTVDSKRPKEAEPPTAPPTEGEKVAPTPVSEVPKPPIVEPGKVGPKELGESAMAFAPEKGFERREPGKEGEGEVGEITKRSDLVRFLTEKLDIPIRTGRFREKALGIFKPKEEVIRTKMANDIEVISHEVGHALQKFLFPETLGKKGLKSTPFTAFKDELDPMATKPGAGQEVTPEGFAEFIRLYVTNEPKAKQLAPRFYSHFEHLIKEKSPESGEILLEARSQFNKYMKQPALARVLSTISIGDKQAKARTLDDLYTATIDDLHPLKVVVDKIRNGEPIPAGKDPYVLARLMRGVGEKAVAFFKHQPFKFETYENVGRPLEDILKPIEGMENEFRAYDKAMRHDELRARGVETGLLKTDVDAVIKEYGPKFKNVHKELLEYRDHVLQYFKDSGMMSTSQYDAMKEANPNYSGYYRVFEELGKGKSGAGTGLEAHQPMKEIKGSWRDTVDPLESTIKDTYLLIELAEKNATVNALVDLAYGKEGMGKYVEKIPAPIEKIQVKEAEIMLALQKFGKWTETQTFRDLQTKVGEKITEVGATGEKVEPTTASEKAAVKMETTAKEALTARGWSSQEAQNVIDRIKRAPSSEAKTKIIEKTIEKTSVMETVKEFGFELPEGVLDIFRPSPFTPKTNVISGWKNGKRQLYQVDPEIARVYQALDRESVDLVTKFFSMPARMLRAGATLTPEFALRNIARDALGAFIYSKHGWSVPFVPSAKGLFEAVNKGDLYWDWKKSGGDHSMVASMDREYFQERLGELLQDSPLKNIVRHPIESLRILSEFSEEATRLGEFEKGIKQLGKTKGDIQQAGFSSRELIDFARKGAKMSFLNRSIAFFNPSLQGTDRMVRAFKEEPLTTGARTFVAITLPSILLAWAQHDDPRYKESPQWQKDLFWVFLPNRMTQAEWDDKTDKEKAAELQLITGSVWRFPKPFEIGVVFGSIPERLTTHILNEDPHAFDGILSSLSRAFTPSIIPTAALPFVENWANKSMFFDRAIVPLGRDELMSEYQYGPYTSETAKKIGELLGRLPVIGEDVSYSPAKIDNLVQGWTGGMGRYAMQIADMGLKMAGVTYEGGGEKPASTLDDIPFIKAFHVRFPSGQAESIQRFYDNHEKTNAEWKTVKALIQKEGRIEKGLEILQDSQMLKLDGFKQALSNMHNMIDMITINPQMTGDEKREFIDITYLQMIEIAKTGNKVVDDMKEIKRRIK